MHLQHDSVVNGEHVLHLRRELDRGGAGAEVGEAEIGLRELAAEVRNMKAQMEAADAVTFVSPDGNQYEAIIDGKMDSWLAEYCGLRIVEGSQRGVPSTAAGAGGMQWDGRFSVSCTPMWIAQPRSAQFYVYGNETKYKRPELLRKTRGLSPGKPKNAMYFAVLEYSRWGDWTHNWTSDHKPPKVRKALPPRLDARLRKCVERAKAAGLPKTTTVLDVVAVVGVVSEYDCKESVEALMSKPTKEFEQLKAMYNAGRFVFIRCLSVIPVGSPIVS